MEYGSSSSGGKRNNRKHQEDAVEIGDISRDARSTQQKNIRSASTISEDSPGLIEQDSDNEIVVTPSTGPKIKLNRAEDREEEESSSKGYISSEDESFSEKREPRKSIELSAKLTEEFKFGRLGVSDKEALLKKTRRSFQVDGPQHGNNKNNNNNGNNSGIKLTTGQARSLSPGSSLWDSDNRFHDDLYFTEDKNSSSWIAKSKSDDRVNRK